ncbi:sulfatase [Paludisphaera rhizosphaerae]|uniref:sulfatase n=1 Tax=Paludisphaera rhizosphaerae TaxID=2711216 RepID=UPI0013EB463E|nr:sulfatase [Paludisphaera rhizosphaerae]
MDEIAARGGRRAALDAFRTALAFGLTAGGVELLLLALRVGAWERGFFLRSRHFVWMVPTSTTMLFAGQGLVAAAVAARWEERPAARRAILGLYVFTAVLGWFLLVRGLAASACGLIALGFAARFGPWLDVRREGLRRFVGLASPTLAVALAGTAVLLFFRDSREASWRRGEAPVLTGVRDVLLIVLDTVRADHLCLYGYDRPTTPNLGRLAGESTVFTRARAAGAWTLPSHATIFTGRWPGELGVERAGWLDGTTPTLAERFRDAGAATGGFVANPFFCGRESGLGRGFQVYADYPLTFGEVFRSSALGWLLARSWFRLEATIQPGGSAGAVRDVDLDFSRKSAATVAREYLAWLDRCDRDDPRRSRFAFLNLFDAHDPYIPPSGFAPRFAVGSRPDTPKLLRDWQRVDKSKLTDNDVRAARDAYDDCLAALDAQLGDLIESLRARGSLDHTILIVTADHGEQFGERGEFGHGLGLYDEEVRVPLLIRAPGLAPAGLVVNREVSLRDVAATTMGLSGLAFREPPLPGVSLAECWRDGGTGATSPAFSELLGAVDPGESTAEEDPPKSWKSVEVDGFSYIRRGDGRESLYELKSDPGQLHDLHAEPAMSQALDRCRRALAEVVSRGSAAAAGGSR